MIIIDPATLPAVVMEGGAYVHSMGSCQADYGTEEAYARAMEWLAISRHMGASDTALTMRRDNIARRIAGTDYATLASMENGALILKLVDEVAAAEEAGQTAARTQDG